MGTKINEYTDYIRNAKKVAQKEGKDYIIVSAKILHSELSKEGPTMPTCCSAMLHEMLEGDVYVSYPETSSGFSTQLVIQYYLHDMDIRKLVNPPKTRGRKKLRNDDELELWLKDKAYQYCKTGEIYQVTLPKGNWIIYLTNPQSDEINDCLLKLMYKINDNTCKLSIFCLNGSSIFKKWKSIPEGMKMKLNITMLVINKNGCIKEKAD